MKSFYFIIGIDTVSPDTCEKSYKKTSCTVHAENLDNARKRVVQVIQEIKKNIYIDRGWELKDSYQENFSGIKSL